MRRWYLIGVAVALGLAGCGQAPTDAVPGQWRSPSMGLVTFTADGWMYIHDERKLVCWQVQEDSIRITDPGELPSEIPLDLSVEGAAMTWQYNGQVISFDRVDANAELPDTARQEREQAVAAGRDC
jgi:hypothetical protein